MSGTIFLLLLIAAVWIALYRNGYLVYGSKAALFFWGRHRGLSASFAACTGTVQRVLRFSDAQPYALTLDAALTKGTLQAEIYDAHKQLLLTLDEHSPTGRLHAHPHTRYTLVLRFHQAEGRYTLHIQPQ